jgi:hypothetical protein
LPKAPEAELVKDSNPLIEGLFNYEMIYVEAYVVHVDMVSQHEVAFKLTPETISTLVEYHKNVHCVDTKASTHNWSEKEVQLKKLQDDFYQAANKFVYRTSDNALEGLEEDGAGELLVGRAEEVKNAIMGMFLPLLPPPPPPVERVHPTPVLPSSVGAENWWHPSLPSTYTSSATESWKYTSAEPVYTSADSGSGMWANMDVNDFQLPLDQMSPTSTCSDSFEATPSPTQFYSLPVTSASYTSDPYVTAPFTSEPTTSAQCTTASVSAPVSQAFQFPPTLAAQQCSPSAGVGFGGFSWDQYENMTAMSYAM